MYKYLTRIKEKQQGVTNDLSLRADIEIQVGAHHKHMDAQKM
jgi:hypothetical protein